MQRKQMWVLPMEMVITWNLDDDSTDEEIEEFKEGINIDELKAALLEQMSEKVAQSETDHIPFIFTLRFV